MILDQKDMKGNAHISLIEDNFPMCEEARLQSADMGADGIVD